MDKAFANLAKHILSIVFLALCGISIILTLLEASQLAWIIVIPVSIICTAVTTAAKLLHNRIYTIQREASVAMADASRKREKAESEAKLWRASLVERHKGFPSLLDRIEMFEKLRDINVSESLKRKKHPAIRASEVVSNETRKRRETERQFRKAETLIELYETYAPFLRDIREDVHEDFDDSFLQDYSEEERTDAATNFLTKEEYRSLNTRERNQLALDRYWSRRKSHWEIGKLYESYIGYSFEQSGFTVEYSGITKRYEDQGRDLVCRKHNTTLIVQCKNWSQFKTVYENHIYQLFGTTFEYAQSNPRENVSAVLVTSTQISEKARRIADYLKVTVEESRPLDTTYPSIKCNINRQAGTKIYHLPFDQMYDQTRIALVGELYCRTVAEAEDAGFRRAFRWKGTNKESE